MKILFAGYRDSRHSKFGGYDYIAQFPDADYLDAAKLPFGFIPVGRCGKKLNLFFLDKFARKMSKKYDVVHYFYSDFMLFFLIKEKRTCKFVATVHMRSENFTQQQIDVLRSFDKVICLSSSEEKLLKENKINAFFVPHGFNAPVFNFIDPQNFDKEQINIFYSGMNYRDFDTFFRAVDFSEKQLLNIHFFAVGQSAENKEKLKDFKNVTVCPHLDDDDYYSLLSLCDYNFLPMTFSTANNALLEAQSLGIKSILPEISGVLDYANGKENIFYKTFEELKVILMNLKKQFPNEDLITYAERFYWKEIYKRLEKVYE